MSRKSKNLDRQPLKKQKQAFDPQNRMFQRNTPLIFENHVQKGNVSKRLSEISKAPTSKMHANIVVPKKSKIGVQHFESDKQHRYLGKSQTHRPNMPKNTKRCVNNSQIGSTTCHNSGYNTSKTNQQRCPGNPKTWADNLWKKDRFSARRIGCPNAKPPYFPKPMFKKVMLSNGFRKLARREPQKKNMPASLSPEKSKTWLQHLANGNPKRCLDKSKTRRPNIPKNKKGCTNNSQIGTPTCQTSGYNASKTKREVVSRKSPETWTATFGNKTGFRPAESDAPATPP